MLIANGILKPDSLAGQVVMVTGAGQGIGYEAARALAWLGAEVIIAEIDRQAGKEAAESLNQEAGRAAATFIYTDVSDEQSVNHLAQQVLAGYGQVDAILNNATVAPLGAVREMPVDCWDMSYRVNLRGPVLLARTFLPAMIGRRRGVFAAVSSTGGAYMGAYEILKAAQVELANTLNMELEGTGVIIFTIGPGMAPTETAVAAIEQLAPLYGQSPAEFYATVQHHFISVEAAGAGFAAAVALAEQFAGQEIGSIQALQAAGIELPAAAKGPDSARPVAQIAAVCHRVRETLAAEVAGWQQRSIFERQWLVRTFKKQAGLPTDQWLEKLSRLEQSAQAGDEAALAELARPLAGLANYYAHLYETAKGYVKNPAEREKQLAIVRGWQDDVEQLASLCTGEAAHARA